MFIFELMKVGKKQYYFLLLILIATIGVYISVNQLDFVNWDDDDNVRLNTKIQTINAENIAYHFTHERYKSLALYSFMFDYALWKQNPAPYHLHNLLLHLINIILVFVVVSKLTNNRVVSLITCALFAFHPVSVEAVAWVTGRKDLLFLLFSLLSILVYRKYTKSDYNIWWLLLLSLLVFIASMAKIQAFVLPLVFVSLDIFYKRKLSGILLSEKVFLFLVAAKTEGFNNGFFILFGFFIFSLFYVFDKVKYKIKLPPKKYALIFYYISVIVCLKYIGVSIVEILVYSFIGSTIIYFLIRKGTLKHFFIDRYFLKPIKFWIITAVTFLISVGSFIITITEYWWQFSLFLWQDSNVDVFSFADRLLLAGNAFIFYIKRLFLLQAFNPMPAYPEPGMSWSLGNVYFVNFLLAISIISLMCFVIIKYFNKNRLVVLGILIFLVNISIVMHIIPIEGRILAADRYAYVSFWGLFIVIAYSIDKLLLKYNYLKLGAVSLICVFLAINSYSNVAYWKNSYTLWLKAVSEDKYNSYALNALGIAYLEIKENVDSALIMIDRALNINPNVPEYHVDKGRVLFKLDSLDSALVCFNNAILLDSTNDMAYNNRGTLYVKIMQYKNAISDFENAIRINNELELYKENYLKAIYFSKIDSVLLSDFATLEFTYEEKIDYVRLASDKLIAQNREQLALKYLLIGIKVCDNDVGMLQNVAAIYSNMGKYNQSISYYKKLLAIFPAHPDYYFYLANNYFNLGDRKNACDNWILAKLYGHKQAAIYFDTYCKKD